MKRLALLALTALAACDDPVPQPVPTPTATATPAALTLATIQQEWAEATSADADAWTPENEKYDRNAAIAAGDAVNAANDACNRYGYYDKLPDYAKLPAPEECPAALTTAHEAIEKYRQPLR